jgi:murein DD-endopeptidase MepM/ murein hydrolase activator NlpD
MTGIVKTVAVVLVAGAICFGQPHSATAEQDTGEADLSGEVPRYYLELLQFSSARSDNEEEQKPALFEYRIEPGDSLYSIAHRFGTDIKTLARLNNIVNPHYIVMGDVIEILTVVGAVHDAEEGDTVSDIAKLYDVGEEVITAANDLNSKDILTRGVRVIVPGAALSRGGHYQSFAWPLHGVLTSGYGWRNGKFHYAIDIAAPYGTPFYAAAAGRVTHAGYLGAYGIMVELDHGNGFLTRYAHASSVAVSNGQQVASGQVIGYIGLTGNTTGPHLHFELHNQGVKVNPLEYLD